MYTVLLVLDVVPGQFSHFIGISQSRAHSHIHHH